MIGPHGSRTCACASHPALRLPTTATMPKVPARLLTGEELVLLKEQEFWTVKEAAGYLRVGEGQIRTSIQSGQIPCFRAGTWMRIPRRQFLAALEAGALTEDTPTWPEDEVVRLPRMTRNRFTTSRLGHQARTGPISAPRPRGRGPLQVPHRARAHETRA